MRNYHSRDVEDGQVQAADLNGPKKPDQDATCCIPLDRQSCKKAKTENTEVTAGEDAASETPKPSRETSEGEHHLVELGKPPDTE